ncbi:hypothetical protein KGY79_12400 [Candidatus Bipolaricaulota bacterium]|nr:hypothetical protein [Candidatus Bipolaricaulota bacterium]
MSEKNDNLYEDARRNHYENLVPLIKQARESIEDIMDSEDDKIRFQASKFVLENAGEWLSGARITGDDGLSDIGDFGREPDKVDNSVLEELKN